MIKKPSMKADYSLFKITEFDEQRHLFEWRDVMIREHPDLKWLNGSINGVPMTINQARKMKAIGMPKGFPDINLLVARKYWKGLFIELKRRPYRDASGRLRRQYATKEQNEWIDHLERQGFRCHICEGADEAKAVILDYLGTKNHPEYVKGRAAGSSATRME